MDRFNLAAAGRARPAVPEVHDVYGCLMPPVEHHHHQYVPHLVAGTQVVQLAGEVAFRDLGDVEQEGRSSDQVHHHHTRQEQLYNISGESFIEPDPVTCRNHADAGHAAEDRRPNPPPLVAEVMRVDLSAEDGQDQGQHRQQVDLSPKSVTVESVEDPRDITAQDADRDACVVQRQPATASLL